MNRTAIAKELVKIAKALTAKSPEEDAVSKMHHKMLDAVYGGDYQTLLSIHGELGDIEQMIRMGDNPNADQAADMLLDARDLLNKVKSSHYSSQLIYAMKDAIIAVKRAFRLLHAAKTAGGGSGIGFTLKGVDSYPKLILVKKGNTWSVQTKGTVKIDKFDALGYEDGKRDNDGGLMKFISLDMDTDSVNDLVKLVQKNYIIEGDDTIEMEIEDIDFDDAMIFKGYVRGKFDEGFPIEFKGQGRVTFEIEGERESDYYGFVLTVAATKKMAEWYEDVFVIGEDGEE